MTDINDITINQENIIKEGGSDAYTTPKKKSSPVGSGFFSENSWFGNLMRDHLTTIKGDNQPKSYMQAVPAPSQSQMWGDIYQTESDEAKMADFRSDVSNYSNSTIQSVVDMRNSLKVLEQAYGQDTIENRPINIANLQDIVFNTGLHESEGGTMLNQQGGPAVGHYGIEPKTARSLVNFGLFGPKALSIINQSPMAKKTYTTADLAGLSDKDWAVLLKDSNVGALLSGTKYLQGAMNLEQTEGPSYMDYFTDNLGTSY